MNTHIKSFKYLAKFKCVGSSCTDSCCSAGWEIKVDNDTLTLYKKNAPVLLSLLKEEEDFLKIDSHGICKSFEGDKLCNIQKNFGEKYLSNTCSLYPRSISKYDNGVVIGGHLSCPEIVRQVLFKEKNPFDITKYSHERLSDKFIEGYSSELQKRSIETEILEKGFKKVYNFVQNNDFGADELLIIFSYISYSMDVMNKADKLEALDFYLSHANERNLVSFEKNYEDLYKILFCFLFEAQIVSPVLHEIFLRIQFELNIKIIDTGKKAELVFNTHNIIQFQYKQKIWDSCKSEKLDEILKKLVFCYLLEADIPFAPNFTSSIEATSIIMCKFILCKFLMISLVDENGNISEQDIINIVESVARIIDHKSSLVTFIANLQENNLYNESSLLGLIQTLTSENLAIKFGKVREAELS